MGDSVFSILVPGMGDFTFFFCLDSLLLWIFAKGPIPGHVDTGKIFGRTVEFSTIGSKQRRAFGSFHGLAGSWTEAKVSCFVFARVYTTKGMDGKMG